MLLTSSQVSVLLTTGMVLICTSALFISGCLIQQRTLRDLRSAIKPRVVTRPKPKIWDDAAKTRSAIRLEDGTMVQIQSSSPGPLDAELVDDRRAEDITIQIQPTVPKLKSEEPEQKPLPPLQKQQDEERFNDNGDALKVEKSAASWDGVQEGGQPLTRAERRKRIKAEIQRLSQGDAPVYYQRRLW